MCKEQTSTQKKTLKEITDEFHAKHHKIMDELGCFWAFGTDRFNEQRQAGVKYAVTDSGLHIPETNVDEYVRRFKLIDSEFEADIKRNTNMDNYIATSLANNEAYYDTNIERAWEEVKPIYPECTEEDMWRIFHQNKHKYN